MIPLKLIDDKAIDNINLSGIQTNSKMIKNGNLFVAINGNNHNGEDYINEAVGKGAVAILTSNKKISENISIYLEGEIAHGHITIKSSILKKYPFDHKGYGEDTRYIHSIFKNNLNVISLPYYKGTAYLSENSSWK